MVYFLIIGIIITVDFLSKKAVAGKLPVGAKKEVVPEKLSLWHIKNEGIAYSCFSQHKRAVLWGTGVLIIAVFGYFIKILHTSGKGLKLGMAFILGGALANFIDRKKNGAVTDFIFIHGKHAPIFNLADISIWIGAVFAFLSALREK